MSNNGGPAFPAEWTNTGDQNRTAPAALAHFEVPILAGNGIAFLQRFRDDFGQCCHGMCVHQWNGVRRYNA
jgi:hypothetical protein